MGESTGKIKYQNNKNRMNIMKSEEKYMKKKLSVVVAMVLVLCLFAGCGLSNGTSNSNEIKLGLDYELTGNAATYGQELVEGIKLAYDEINKSGGVLGKQIKLVEVDNKSDTSEAANAASKLATRDKVLAILGPATSGNTKSAIPVATQNKVPLITASATADDITVDSNGKVRDFIFKTCFNDSFQGVVMADFAYKDKGFKNAALLIDNASDYSKGLAKNFKETFKKLGGNVVTEQAYQSKDTDFKAVLTKIKGSNADVIYLPGYYDEVSLILKQAKELQMDLPVLGGDGYDSPKVTDVSQKEGLSNIYFTNHYSVKDTSAEVTKFRDSFKAKYNKEPDSFNALGYDMACLVADGIKRAKTLDRAKLKEALASTKDFDGVTGKISIDKNHNPLKSITILQVKNGEQTFVKKLLPDDK